VQYVALGAGRWFLRLDPEDELVAVLKAFAQERGITGGFIHGLGSTQSAVLSFFDPEAAEYVKRRFDEPMEIGALSGTISVSASDGRPFVHLHAVLAPRELITYSGHVHEARCGMVMEVFVEAFDARLERRTLPDKPFPWLVLPGESPPDSGGATP
jgi:predicted DNA-binding protein with PD1-like motif